MEQTLYKVYRPTQDIFMEFDGNWFWLGKKIDVLPNALKKPCQWWHPVRKSGDYEYILADWRHELN